MNVRKVVEWRSSIIHPIKQTYHTSKRLESVESDALHSANFKGSPRSLTQTKTVI